jgi:hypothetical protein
MSGSNMKIYLDYKPRVFTQDEVDTLLTALHGSIMNRIKLIIKRIILFYKNIFDYRLIVMKNKFVYIIRIGEFKKELSEESYYSYFMMAEEREDKLQ